MNASGSSYRESVQPVFAQHGQPRRMRRGERLHVAGSELRQISLMVEGWVARSRASEAGEPLFTAIHIAGDIVGADTLLRSHIDDDLVALTDVTLLRLPVETLRTCGLQDARVAMGLVDGLAADATFLREALLAVGRQSSSERVSTFLLQTHRRLVEAGLIDRDARSFDLPLTQVQLAVATAMTAVHVNRVLRSLEKAGCLTFRRGVVVINDMAALENEARAGSIGLQGRSES